VLVDQRADGTPEYVTTSDVSGLFDTEGLPPGTYRVRAQPPGGVPTSFPADFATRSGVRTQLALGVFRTVAIRGTVYDDANGNGARDPGEAGRNDVAVVLNVTGDHLGLGGITSIRQLANVKQVVVEAVRKDGGAVLNAEDPLVAEMAAATDAEVVYFGVRPQHVIAAHLAQGGRCVFVDDEAIVLAQGSERVALVEIERVGFTAGGKIRFQVLNALAAAAAAWAAGLNPALIARALTTFTSDTQMAPGRFNVREVNGVQLVVDYGHNAAAMAALGEAMTALGRRRTVLVIGLPGDRRNEDLCATIAATASFVDEYVLFDHRDRRGRAKNEVPRLLRRQLPPGVPCQLASNEETALSKAWQRVRPGDRLVVIVDEVDGTLQAVDALVESVTMDAACISPIALEVGALR
jgi:cyanophycin synthetase